MLHNICSCSFIRRQFHDTPIGTNHFLTARRGGGGVFFFLSCRFFLHANMESSNPYVQTSTNIFAHLHTFDMDTKWS
jgi:hypothetical protein